ncbi:MAG: hypothetical protein IJU45_05455 [Clostridia bacterium]|nr:hypothetical protein [Clostridia bacterium]
MADKKRSGKKILSKSVQTALKIVLVVFIVISVVFIAARTIGGVTLKSLVSDIKTTVQNLGAGEGYPYRTSGAEIEKAYSDSANIFVFSKSKTLLLSPSAKNIAEVPIEYGRPGVSFKNGKAVVFDRDSGQYRLQSSSDIIFENTLKDCVISTAAISKNGTCAVAYTDENSQHRFKVFNKSQKVIFEWTFSSERVTSTDISDDNNYAVVSTVFAKNAVMNSKVYVFKFDGKDYVSCFDFNGCTVVNVSYNKNHDIAVISDKGRTYIEDNSSLCEQFEFNSDVLFKCTDNKNSISAVALRKYGGDTFGTVKVFRGKKYLCSIDTDKEIKGVSVYGSRICVLTSNEALLYNKKGEKISDFKLDSSYNDALLVGKKVYLVNSFIVNRKKF